MFLDREERGARYGSSLGAHPAPTGARRSVAQLDFSIPAGAAMRLAGFLAIDFWARVRILRRSRCGMEMPIGLLTLEIHILDAQSLKDKRQVLRSLKDRLRAHYNVAVAELEHQETWQRSRVGVVTISGDSGYLEKTLAEIAAESERLLGRDLVSQNVEYFEDQNDDLNEDQNEESV